MLVVCKFPYRAVFGSFSGLLCCPSLALSGPFDGGPLTCLELPTPEKGSEFYKRLETILDEEIPGAGGRRNLDIRNDVLVSECDTFAVVRIIPGGAGTTGRIGTIATIVFGKSQWIDWTQADYAFFLY